MVKKKKLLVGKILDKMIPKDEEKKMPMTDVTVSQADKDKACEQCVYNNKTEAISKCDKYTDKSKCALLNKIGKTVRIK